MRSPLVYALFFVAPLAQAQQPEQQYTALEASLIRDNICAKSDVQGRLIDFYNEHPQMTATHGAIVKASDLKTTHVSVVNQDLTCSGNFTFADGSTRVTNVGVPFDFRQP
jgi:hypothetical protein